MLPDNAANANVPKEFTMTMTNKKVINTYAFTERDIHVKSEPTRAAASLQNTYSRYTPYPKPPPSTSLPFSLPPSYPWSPVAFAVVVHLLTFARSHVNNRCGSPRMHRHPRHERLLLQNSQIPRPRSQPTQTPSPNAQRQPRHPRWLLPVQSEIQPTLRQVHRRRRKK